MRTTSAFQPKNSTKAYYPLNGNSVDFSGNTNTGTDTAITYPQGRFGQGALFVNASNSNISLPTGARQPGSFTFSTWIKPTSITSKNGDNIVSLFSDWGGSTRNYLINQGLRKLVFQNGNGASLSDTNLETADILLPNRWYNTVFTRSGAVLTIYVNGVFTATRTGTHSGGTTANTLRMGHDASATATYGFDGQMDESIIEDRAWTAKEIELYYRKSMLNYKQKNFAQALLEFTISEALALVESVTSLRGLITTTAETTTLTETITTLRGISFTVAESLGLIEAFNSTRTFIFNIAENLGLIEFPFTLLKKWNEKIKNSSVFTPRTKNSSTFTPKAKNSSTWTPKDRA